MSLISDGALLVRDGRIDQAGTTRRVENLRAARNAREINAAGRVVMPGFVDNRAELWPKPAYPAAGAPIRSGRLLADSARKVLAGMARHGTTTLCAVTSAPPGHVSEIKLLRVLAGLQGKPLDVCSAYVGGATGDSTTRIESLCAEVMPLISRRKLARFAVANCAVLEPSDTRRFLACARRLGFRLRVCAARCPTAIRLALEMDAESVVVGGVPEEEIEELARSRTIGLLQPASDTVLLDRRRSARALIESGAAVALASGFGLDDGPTYNMQMVISLACSEMEFSPAEAVSAATINAAHALGYGEECGSLEPGKRADVIILNTDDYRDLSYRFGINHVHMVLKNGAIIYQEGEVKHCEAQ
ncbi:MAG TPA: amidohydrolase family protein [Bryobacteraceae bacterium]|nr:amidohydrolase family protein [Bryobacteraceae bacterium]